MPASALPPAIWAATEVLHVDTLLQYNHSVNNSKGSANREKNQIKYCFSEVQPIFGEAKGSANREKNQIKYCFSEVQPIFGEVKDSAKRVYYKKSPCFYGGAPSVYE
jgi:hypothetical protein